MMTGDFYRNLDFKYPEIAECIEDTDGPTAKIFIPIATPTLSKNVAYDTIGLPLSLANIQSSGINKGNLSRITESNYIEMKLPDDQPAKKGDRFIIVFIGGDVNNGVLIGRCR